MELTEALAMIKDSREVPEPVAREMSVVQKSLKEGIFIDWYTFGVNLRGEEIGEVYICDAVTFRSAVYKGRDPMETTKEIRLDLHGIHPRDPNRMYRWAYNKNRELPGSTPQPQLLLGH